jgi:hypothetical protein
MFFWRSSFFTPSRSLLSSAATPWGVSPHACNVTSSTYVRTVLSRLLSPTPLMNPSRKSFAKAHPAGSPQVPAAARLYAPCTRTRRGAPYMSIASATNLGGAPSCVAARAASAIGTRS